MLFSIAMALMVVLIAGFWTYQGFFSSVLMFFECVIACAVAFGFYEALNSVWAASLGSGTGLPLAFMVLFLGVLALLRVATDKFLPDNVRLPMIADRAGAAVFGLLTGLLLVGTALVGVQMLPIGAEIFTYDRVTAKPDGTTSTSGFLLGPDAFAVWLANRASAGGLGGETPLGQAKPDLLMDLYGARSCVQTEDRHDIPPDGIKVNAYWEARQIDHANQRVEGISLVRDFETRDATSGKFLVFDVTIDRSACLKDKSDLYFRLPQFRLIGPPPETGAPKVYLACGISDVYVHRQYWGQVQEGQPTRLVRFRPDTDFFLTPNIGRVVEDRGGYRVSVAFEVPEDFEPWYLAFKSGAKCEINKQKMFRATPPKNAAAALGSAGPGRSLAEARPQEGKGKVGKPVGGATHVADAKEAYVSTRLPLALPKKESVVQRGLKGSKLGESHFFVEVPKDEVPKKEQVTEFSVPDDKKLVIIDADRNTALSMYGRALNYASNVAAQITLSTAEGTTYFAQGVYSLAKVGGKPYFEIQYHPDAEVPERCLEKPKKVTAAALRDTPPGERKFGYVFIVDPGVKIVSFSSGGTGGRQSVEIEVPK
jgi:hypothetical protein